MTAHSSYGGRYNRLHGNWGEKTLCKDDLCSFSQPVEIIIVPYIFVAEKFSCVYASSPYENILATKISQFTAYAMLLSHMHEHCVKA